MVYRTRTYLAADWEHDSNIIEQLRCWNNSDHWSIHFTDAHDLTSARDSSLNCTIKESLRERLRASKRFVLIVSDYTNTRRAGSCVYCDSYNSRVCTCRRGHRICFDSYLDYECRKAIEMDLEIIVLYVGARVNRNNCPEALKNIGLHIPVYTGTNRNWNYIAIRDAFRETE